MIIKRILSFLLGLIILSLGISFSILSDLGAGAWDALSVGLANLTGFTVGTWTILVGVILIFINALLLKNRPDFIAMVTVLIIGYFIDFWLLVIFPNFVVGTIVMQVIILLSGVLLMGFGIATYLQGKFAVVPIDRFMLAIQKRAKVSLGVAKTLGEVTALILAFIVGGPVWVGTIIVTLSIGPLIQIFFPHLERLIHGSN
ncbi:membrane protein [Anaerobacillus sp. CMMVII]|uniref:YczE/YyaS/YitT family protein n=1 Tax=Anaerobacillus sp. CMMVII TaxID=2755588 RepID=UPI0021B8163F|nr:membrane protein [Anaerobacillus sp. CMMVII]MCT8136831.1 membrane protein [Anaerobacillus sp. CMMVII]